MLNWELAAKGKRYDYWRVFDPSSYRYIYQWKEKGARHPGCEAGYFRLASIVSLKNDEIVETFFADEQPKGRNGTCQN